MTLPQPFPLVASIGGKLLCPCGHADALHLLGLAAPDPDRISLRFRCNACDRTRVLDFAERGDVVLTGWRP